MQQECGRIYGHAANEKGSGWRLKGYNGSPMWQAHMLPHSKCKVPPPVTSGLHLRKTAVPSAQTQSASRPCVSLL